MPTILIIIAVGIGIASLVAFATTMFVPGQESNSTEDRLSAMSSRRGGAATRTDKPSLLMTSGLTDTKNLIDEFIPPFQCIFIGGKCFRILWMYYAQDGINKLTASARRAFH
mgnify:CR=1 FL=1